ncbi:hypothetical protein [Streptomyces sp. NPDC051546]|uniref:hypothetical protein n=1 Tax=Streptomyces sp. NPDC051546 TaxID=3365655 RepID=UPI0037B09F42
MAGVPVRERAVEALLSLSGGMVPLPRQWVGAEPDCGPARGLLALAAGDGWDDTTLKEQLVIAHRNALGAGAGEASVVYGVFLHTHRQYRLAADHLVGHFGRWPAGMAEVFHTFNLALALAVEAATADLHALARRAAADPRAEYREVLSPVVRALAEITAGNPAAAVRLLSGLDEDCERIGGLRVEREIIQDTLARGPPRRRPRPSAGPRGARDRRPDGPMATVARAFRHRWTPPLARAGGSGRGGAAM